MNLKVEMNGSTPVIRIKNLTFEHYFSGETKNDDCIDKFKCTINSKLKIIIVGTKYKYEHNDILITKEKFLGVINNYS